MDDLASTISSMDEIRIPDNDPQAIELGGGFLIPSFVHRDFLTEAECILFESMGVTVWCKSWLVIYRGVLMNDFVFAAVRLMTNANAPIFCCLYNIDYYYYYGLELAQDLGTYWIDYST